MSLVRESRGQLMNEDATLKGIVVAMYILFSDFCCLTFSPAHGPHG